MLRAALSLLLFGLALAFAPAPAQAQSQPMGVVLNCWTGTAWTPCQLNGGGLPIGSVAPYLFTAVPSSQFGLAITTSTALTVPATAAYARVCARGANVQYTEDGTVPTATVGTQLLQNQCQFEQGPSVLGTFRAIQQSATATLDVSYFK